jgi:ATP-dependent Clp protease protease subunit
MAQVRNKTPTPYFSLTTSHEEKTADIYIFGNIAQNRGGLAGLFQANSDQSSYDLANQIAHIPEDYDITVHINSNGGELKEGLGIYNTLKERNVTTICEGFAASAGSVIFCAGKTRIMQPASLLFIHQASMEADGNADDFEKAADDLRTVTAAAVAAYRESGVNISDEQLDKMLKAETWLTPEEAVVFGFATEINEPEDEEKTITNDAMGSVMAMVEAGKHPVDANPAVDFAELTREYSDVFDLVRTVKDIVSAKPELITMFVNALSSVTADHKQEQSKTNETKGFFGFHKGE